MNFEQMKNIGIKEAYLPIDDFHNYEISNYGNVRNKKTGKILKHFINHGYKYVNLCNDENKQFKKAIHRLVLHAFENNYANKKCVDHIDNDRLNNCLFNLRYVSYQENMFNCSARSDNTSGLKGVSWCKPYNKWRAYIFISGKQISLGVYDNLEDAKIARQNKARELFGDYVNKCEK
jgi:hypothetical protein